MHKARDAFRTIAEVAETLALAAHVLRFWEQKFPQIEPLKRAGGRRYYRPKDVELIAGIKCLLYDQGLTIRGAQKILSQKGRDYVLSLGRAAMTASSPSQNTALSTAPSLTSSICDNSISAAQALVVYSDRPKSTEGTIMADDTNVDTSNEAQTPDLAPQSRLPGLDMRLQEAAKSVSKRKPRLTLAIPTPTTAPDPDTVKADPDQCDDNPRQSASLATAQDAPLLQSPRETGLDDSPRSQKGGGASGAPAVNCAANHAQDPQTALAQSHPPRPIAARIREASAHIWLVNTSETQEILTRMQALFTKMHAAESAEYALEE